MSTSRASRLADKRSESHHNSQKPQSSSSSPLPESTIGICLGFKVLNTFVFRKNAPNIHDFLTKNRKTPHTMKFLQGARALVQVGALPQYLSLSSPYCSPYSHVQKDLQKQLCIAWMVEETLVRFTVRTAVHKLIVRYIFGKR